jgi:hypothetical protein
VTSAASRRDLLYFNGVDGESGEYALPPVSGQDLSDWVQGLNQPENMSDLRFRYRQATAKTLGVREGVDPLKLDEAGWGVIFAHNASAEVRGALKGLLDLRREQAGARFRLYEGADGWRPGESKSEFLGRHGAGPGPADPDRVPYYLLIVGSPQEIPYSFQSQLDVQYAVGRIFFDEVDEYARYARSVVAAERGEVRLPRRAAFFATANPDDEATRLSADALVEPLYGELSAKYPQWQMQPLLREQASKHQLARLLDGSQTPALLFTAGHGMEFPLDSPRQFTDQGALLCQDWPGPLAWQGRGPIPAEFYFSAADLINASGTNTAATEGTHTSAAGAAAGAVAFFYACYGAGTPHLDDFSKFAFKQRAAIAPHAFVARLPMKMLSHPAGGALAVIGHVERAWGYSFFWEGAGAQTTVFSSTLERLLKGHPVGSALEYFNQRYAELATVLSDTLEEISFGKNVDPLELAGLWTAANDARGYSILGDPAVRLAVG